jgi:TusA-related sulfurtransferase
MEKHLQVLGMVCPFPVVEAEREMNSMAVGDELMIDFDCTQATEALPRWALKQGHHIVEFEQTGDAQWRIKIRKQG